MEPGRWHPVRLTAHRVGDADDPQPRLQRLHGAFRSGVRQLALYVDGRLYDVDGVADREVEPVANHLIDDDLVVPTRVGQSTFHDGIPQQRPRGVHRQRAQPPCPRAKSPRSRNGTMNGVVRSTSGSRATAARTSSS